VKATGDPAKSDRLISDLAEGLNLLHQDERDPRVMNTARHPAASALQGFVAASANRDGRLSQLHIDGDFPFDGFEVQFSKDDWFRWALSFFTWWGRIVPHEFPQAAAEPVTIPNTYRVAIVGDWGTGLYGAPFCAQSIEDDPDGYDLLLHLGDTYYSGLDNEVQDRFLRYWPIVPTAASRALNGNHEMYSGGYAYFDDILPRFGQQASYFALQNDFFTLIALDTAYQDHDLTPGQVAWMRHILDGAGNRKVVLFSHHQPFSLLDDQGPNLVDKLRDFLEGRKIFAWYWGHEHRCVLYDRHPDWGLFGRCAGHGGFPENRVDVSNAPTVPGLYDGWHRLGKTNESPGGLLLDSPNVYVAGFENDYGPNGYVRLDFRDGVLHESVRAPQAANLYDRPVGA
jgi:hypothetical protein